MDKDTQLLSENKRKACKIEVAVLEYNALDDNRIYLWRQVLCTFTVVLICVLGSMVNGYSGILLPQLQAPETIIKISKEDESWIAAMAPLQMCLGCILSTWSMDKFGRKRCNIMCSIMALLGWGIIYVSNTLTHLLIGRVICGFSVGLCGMPSTAYVAETSSTQRRGVFLSLLALGIAAGILISHLLGTFLTWHTTALVTMVLPIIIFALLCYLPESHVWYINQNEVEMARASFLWFRGSSEIELDEFKRMVHNSSGTTMAPLDRSAQLRKQEFYRPLMILFLFFTTAQASGNNVVTFYSVQLMQMTVPSLDKYAAMLIIDVARFLVSILATILIKQYRVRVLLFISAIGTVASLFGLSIFAYMSQIHPENKVLTTIPLVWLMTYIFFVSIGLVPLPWTVCGEIMPSATKGIGGSIACTINFLIMFIVVKTSPFLFDKLETHGTLALYGALVIVGTVGLYFVLPETKNRTLLEIQDFFKPRTSKKYQSFDETICVKL